MLHLRSFVLGMNWQGVTLLVRLPDGVDQATAYLWTLWRNGHL